jgi:hypothetical protein
MPEGRGRKLTIKMITFDDIENMHVMLRATANRDGGSAEGRKCLILVLYMEAVVDDIRA